MMTATEIRQSFLDFFRAADADVFCLQETKLQPHQIELELPGYHQYPRAPVCCLQMPA